MLCRADVASRASGIASALYIGRFPMPATDALRLWPFLGRPQAHPQIDRRNRDDVVVVESDLRRDTRAADACAIGAAEIGDGDVSPRLVDVDVRVAPRHAVYIQPDGAAGAATDHVVASLERKSGALPCQPARHRRVFDAGLAFLARVTRKRVADAVRRPDETRLPDVIVQRLADFTDQHVEIGVDDERVGPDAGVEDGL